MITDTLTIVLDGDVPLGEFSRTIKSFYELVTALSQEVGTPDLDWVLEDLQFSSAVATVRAKSNPAAAERVVRAYADVGHALETHTPILFSPRVRTAAKKVVSIRDGRIKAVRFETSLREATVRTAKDMTSVEPSPLTAHLGIPEVVGPRLIEQANLRVATAPSLGGIQGRVQALSNRGGLRFTIYDLLYDKAIGCYMAEGKEELLRNVWGKLAVVEGLITRDPITGRPLAIRQVSNITQLPDPRSACDYEDARGIVRPLDGLSPEEAIRRVRDA